ncbi:Homeodomain-like protein, partial [Mycena capillaripes]
RYIHPAQKRHVITMAEKGMKNDEIAAAINIGESTVRRIKRLWYTTGYVVAHPKKNGRPPILSTLDLEYLEALIERQPDIYLSELAVCLHEGRGVDVEAKTISRAL